MIVTIVEGDVFKRMAEITIPLMEECLGEPVKVLPGGEDPWRTKLSLLADTTYTFVDVDVVFRRPYDLSANVALAQDGFFVAPVAEYQKMHGLPATFVTSGMFTLDPKANGELLEVARSRYVFRGLNSLKDEYALNEALQMLRVPVHQLPVSVHRFPYYLRALSDEDVSRHYCGGSCDSFVRISHIQNAAKAAWKNLGRTPPPDVSKFLSRHPLI